MEFFLFLLQWTATVAGHSRFAASQNKPRLIQNDTFVPRFWATFAKNWAIFYYNIRSHTNCSNGQIFSQAVFKALKANIHLFLAFCIFCTRRRWRWSRSKELKRQLARCPCWSMAQSSPTSSSWVACWCNPGCSSLSLALPPSLCYRMAYLHMTKIMLRKMLNCYIITYIIWNPYYNILIGIKGWNIEFQVKKYFVI